MSKKIDALVFLSDIHAGSKYSPCPVNFEGVNGIIQPNALQLWYNLCLTNALSWTCNVLAGRRWGLVLNGDLIEGIHHGTAEVVSADVADHKGIAEELLVPWAKSAARTWVVEGTECHTRGHESSVAKALKAEPYRNPSCGTRQGAWPELAIEVNGCYIIVRHHITTSIRPWTEATGLCTQINSERIEHVRSDHRVPRWAVYSHRHKEGMFSDGHAAVYVLPPWQALPRHGRKVVGHSRFPRPGVLILDFADVESDGMPVARRRMYDYANAKDVIHA